MRQAPQKRVLTAEERTTALSAWADGRSTKEISRLLGVSNAFTMKGLLIELGVDWEPRLVTGLVPNGQGYLMRWVREDEPFADMRNQTGYVPEHRYQMALALGRSLKRHEQVHHINGVRDDNRIENLQLRSTHHGAGVSHRCLDCGGHNIASVRI